MNRSSKLIRFIFSFLIGGCSVTTYSDSSSVDKKFSFNSFKTVGDLEMELRLRFAKTNKYDQLIELLRQSGANCGKPTEVKWDYRGSNLLLTNCTYSTSLSASSERRWFISTVHDLGGNIVGISTQENFVNF